MRPLTLGTRGSALALRQAEIVHAALHAAIPGLQVEQRTIRTEGDARQDVSLEDFGGQGVFVKDIERQLLSGVIDLAIHSLKDMPAALPDGLTIGAVLPRGDVHDVLVARDGRGLADLPSGARVGSDSRRRAVQVLALRPDIEVVSIRGNVDSRAAKVGSGEYDGVILAAAGLDRLGLAAAIAQVFSIEEVLPAVGQAVLAIECRAVDKEVLELLQRVEDEPTRTAITAERAFLRRLGAGCRLPVGAYGQVEGRMLRLQGLLADDQNTIARETIFGSVVDAERLGTELAERLASAIGVEVGS
jgi:hydroxymethylbilane synthase